MKIVVCIKQVIDPDARLRLDPKTDSIDQSIIGYVVNPTDLFSIEEALRIRDESDGGKVTVLTVGPTQTKDILMKSLAMGADEAVHLWDKSFEGSDNHVTSTILTKAIGRIGCDLILCGKQASDDSGQQVPAMIAEMMGMPFVSAVTRIDIRPAEKKVETLRSMGKGDREVVECNLPALLSVEGGINRPRYSKVRSRLQAEHKEIATWGCDALGLNPEEVGVSGSMVEVRKIAYPKPRAKKIAAPPPNLPPHLRLQWLMKGGGVAQAKDKGSEFVEGSPQDIASRVMKYLTDEKILSARDKK